MQQAYFIFRITEDYLRYQHVVLSHGLPFEGAFVQNLQTTIIYIININTTVVGQTSYNNANHLFQLKKKNEVYSSSKIAVVIMLGLSIYPQIYIYNTYN